MTDRSPDIFDRLMSLPGLRRLWPFWQKSKPVLLYLFFGACTTVISIGSFALCHEGLHINELIANVISWLCAVLFAYVTNRVWVFDSKARGREIGREMLSFFAGRLITLGLEEALLLTFVTLCGFNGTLIKVIAQVVVLVLNYVISKFLVFHKK